VQEAKAKVKVEEAKARVQEAKARVQEAKVKVEEAKMRQARDVRSAESSLRRGQIALLLLAGAGIISLCGFLHLAILK